MNELKKTNNIIDKKLDDITNNIKKINKNETKDINKNEYNKLLEIIKQKDLQLIYMNNRLLQYYQIINNLNQKVQNDGFNDKIYLDDKYYNKIKKYIKTSTNKSIKGVILNNDGNLEYVKLKRNK